MRILEWLNMLMPKRELIECNKIIKKHFYLRNISKKKRLLSSGLMIEHLIKEVEWGKFQINSYLLFRMSTCTESDRINETLKSRPKLNAESIDVKMLTATDFFRSTSISKTTKAT